MAKPKFIYLMGVTCVGKDYFAEYLQSVYPNNVGLIQVGKEMRKRHPPEYFKGLGAMQSTEPEALEIFNEQRSLAASQRKEFILVVGQPRMSSQINETIGRYPGLVLWMHCPPHIQQERIAKRFENDPGSLALAQQRVENDKSQLYNVVLGLFNHFIIETFDTTIDTKEYVKMNGLSILRDPTWFKRVRAY